MSESNKNDSNITEAVAHLKTAPPSLNAPIIVPLHVMRTEIRNSIAALIMKGGDEDYDNAAKLLNDLEDADKIKDGAAKITRFSEIMGLVFSLTPK